MAHVVDPLRSIEGLTTIFRVKVLPATTYLGNSTSSSGFLLRSSHPQYSPSDFSRFF